MFYFSAKQMVGVGDFIINQVAIGKQKARKPDPNHISSVF